MDEIKNTIQTIIMKEIQPYQSYVRRPVIGYASVDDWSYVKISDKLN